MLEKLFGKKKKSGEEEAYENAFNVVQNYLSLALMFQKDEMDSWSDDDFRVAIAFEFGMMEYVYQNIIAQDVFDFTKEDASGMISFIKFYLNKKYSDPELLKFVAQMWGALIEGDGVMHEIRELGWDAIAKHTREDGSQRPGHFPGAYLKKALEL